MIRRYLICGKQLYLTAKRLEDCPYPMIELLLPLQLYWEVEAAFEKIEYAISANEDLVILNDLYAWVVKKVERYAVIERDRIFLRDKIKTGASPTFSGNPSLQGGGPGGGSGGPPSSGNG